MVDLLPGGHVIILGSWETGLEGRRRGLELRDTLLIVSAQEPRFAFLFRAGLEGTVAENVLKHGTGGLNIDACRVGISSISTHSRGANGAFPKRPGEHSAEESGRKKDQRNDLDHSERTGRWPTNLVFVHGMGCKRVGEKSVRGRQLVGGYHGSNNGQYESGDGRQYAPDTCEVAWECSPDCPVKALDDQGKQAGIHSSGSPRGYKAGYTTEPGYTGSWSTNPYGGMRHDDGDSGSFASRFFPQFENEAALIQWLKTLIGAV